MESLVPVLEGQGEVEIVEHGNDDLTVVNAARVSNAKRVSSFIVREDPSYAAEREAVGMKGDDSLLNYLAANGHWTPFGHARHTYTIPTPRKLLIQTIPWLADRPAGWALKFNLAQETATFSGSAYNWIMAGHRVGSTENLPPAFWVCRADVLRRMPWSRMAFKMPYPIFTEDMAKTAEQYRMDGENHPELRAFTFRIKMPVYVARQWMRSNVEIVYNETSRRYVDEPPDFHRPSEWRGRPEKGIKQGSGSTLVKRMVTPGALSEGCESTVAEAYNFNVWQAGEFYNAMIDAGVAPEMARMVLPQSMMTELWMTATARAIKRIAGLRANAPGDEKNHAQAETAQYARAIIQLIESRHPGMLKAVEPK